ncbi:GM2A [Mytilus edulis]|uniref:GM2A n=1 Tax=Mytilus edulis TaxID=6550 RepID=A0A8S3UWX5_MYTED|nr:GM2A [Mytilus edulis]
MYKTQLFVLVLTVCSTFAVARVVKVHIHDQDDKVVQFTMNRVESFTWKNCGGNGFGVSDLSLTPDPLEFPGTIHLAMKAYFNTTIQSPLPTTLLIEKEIEGKYIKIPCIDNFGSCTYDDLCELLDEANCPDPLVKAGIPCQCPFKPAQYTLPTSDFDVETSFFPSGGYHMKGSIGMNGKTAGCLEIFFSVA